VKTGRIAKMIPEALFSDDQYAKEIDIKHCAIESVVVYQTQALIMRRVQIQVPKGKGTVTTSNIPPGIISNSLRVSTSSEVLITDVSYHHTEEANPAEQLQTTLRQLTVNKQKAQIQLQALELELQSLTHSMSMIQNLPNQIKSVQARMELMKEQYLSSIISITDQYTSKTIEIQKKITQTQNQLTGMTKNTNSLTQFVNKFFQSLSKKSCKSMKKSLILANYQNLGVALFRLAFIQTKIVWLNCYFPICVNESTGIHRMICALIPKLRKWN
jgi:hypothetical protein